MSAPSSPTAPSSRSSSAPERPAAPRSAGPTGLPRLSPSWLAAQGRLPLAFMALGLAWLAAATALMVARPDALALSHAAPPVVALAHAWMLGFFVTIATGAIYQIAPVALGTTLASERYGWWHFGLHAVSVPGMVYAFWHWDMTLLGHVGSAFALGIGLFAANTWRTIRRSGQRDAVAWSLSLATGWLLITVAAGLFLAANRIWDLWSVNPLALLRAHAHLGLVGFFVTLLQGVTFRLVPMFTLGDVPDWRSVRLGLWLSQLGLLGLAPALALNWAYAATGFGALIFVGMLFTARALKRALATRKKRQHDPGISAFVRGAIGIALAALPGLVLVWPKSPWGSAPGGFNAMIYAILLFVGGLLPAFAGMLCKIVPFLTWMRAYGPKVGRVPTPAAGALTRPGWERWAFALMSGATLPLTAGAWLLHPRLLSAGVWLLAAGVALFLFDMLGVLKHLRSSARSAAQTTTPLPR